MSDERLILVFNRPPEEWGFIRAKAGDSWWLKVEGRDRAMALAEELALRGIHGVIKKLGGKLGSPARIKPWRTNPHAEARHGGFGGKLNAEPIKGTWRRRRRPS
jgi:hypothetical protein